MNGQQHYITAEQLLIEADAERGRGSTTTVALLASLALAHATLANAAAAAIGGRGPEEREWLDAAGTTRHGGGTEPRPPRPPNPHRDGERRGEET